jgi:HSP20 family protein
MANSLEKWMGGWGVSPFREFAGLKSFQFSPSCEISENKSHYLLKFDLPGVPKDQVKVEIDNNTLTVQAERREEEKRENGKKFFSEISYGSYTRSFTLPGPVDEKQVEANFKNGVLTVAIPKTETSNAKQIKIQ